VPIGIEKLYASIADRITARKLMRSGKLNGIPSRGRLNMFFYDPKYKRHYHIMIHFHFSITFRNNLKVDLWV
jgi:hypothetical protein